MAPPRPKLRVREVEIGHRSGRKGTYALAVDGLSFDVAPNEFIAVVGPSGCGKTTFLTAVAGLIPISGGTLELDDHRIDGPGRDRSLVFQQASLFPWRNVVQNIEFGLKAHGRLDAAGRARVAELVELVGLGGKGDKYPRELSGGMSQRVNLARALATDPELILLDEPFAALDAQTREVMQEELTRIWQADGVKAGKTAMFITHDVPEAVFLADRVLVLSRGPAHLVADIHVDLPRPRTPAMKRTPEFLAMSDRIVDLVMAQSQIGKQAQPGRRVTSDDHAGVAAG
ncbi:ABC transporter ATP-binding protein [Pseudonocardia dioxanivorans]|uniref:ABC transporter ATP-binding protein n=1 Tax=Pseudonocardia dioxanivorans TaxID=240495 RepID=UPI000CD0A00F|nr:ABC transporter ATP-binding protein [Pseudonocardia dioxanivorans]